MQIRAQFEGHLLALLRHRPTVYLPAAKKLEQLCRQHLDAESQPSWCTFWSLTTHFFEGLRSNPGHDFEAPQASAAAQVLSGLLLREYFNEHGAPVEDKLQVINHLLFLEQADVISQRLAGLVSAWSESPTTDVPAQAQLDVQSMLHLAQDVALAAVQEIAAALVSQLSRLRTHHTAEDIQASLSGVQELSRLLQHFAVGSLREPQPHVLAALRDEALA